MSQAQHTLQPEFWTAKASAGHSVVFDGTHIEVAEAMPADCQVIYDRAGVYRCCSKNIKLSEQQCIRLGESVGRIVYARCYHELGDANDLVAVRLRDNSTVYLPVSQTSESASDARAAGDTLGIGAYTNSALGKIAMVNSGDAASNRNTLMIPPAALAAVNAAIEQHDTHKKTVYINATMYGTNGVASAQGEGCNANSDDEKAPLAGGAGAKKGCCNCVML